MKKLSELTAEQAAHKEAVKNFKPKDRQFVLLKQSSPVTYAIQSRHIPTRPLIWFDYMTDTPKELRYATNQASVFVDEQKGSIILGDVVLMNGTLHVPKNNVALQKLLLFYHPAIGKTFEEFNPEKKAQVDVNNLEQSIKASMSVIDMDITDLEAIARVALGSVVDNLKSSSIKRDMILWARENPVEFERLANDKDIKLRNLAQRSIDFGILGVRDSGTTVFFVDTDETVLKVPFGENVVMALASYLQTDKGLKVMDRIAMKLQE